MKKIIVLGDTLLNDEPLGIQRFAYEILHEIDHVKRDYEIELVIPENVGCKIKFDTIKIVRFGNCKSAFIWRQVYFPKYVHQQKGIAVDLTLGLCVFNSGIVGIFDCIYEKYPLDFRSLKEKLKRFSYKVRAKIAICFSMKIITISEHSKRDILDYYRIPESKIELIGCGWQHFQRITEDISIIEKLGLTSENYVFALGSSLPHKNFEWILRAAKCNQDYKFVVTGTNRLSNYQSYLETYNYKNLMFTGFLSDEEVKALMKMCSIFVHPSLYEGFAIPPLEALSCGAPVAVSNATCLPEIFGASVSYFDPLEENPDIDCLRTKQRDLRKEEIEKTLLQYDWRKSALLMDDVFKSVVRSGKK